MATVKVLAGDLLKGQQRIDLRHIKDAELQTEEKLKKLAGSAGWGFAGAVVGGLLTGGIGLAVGGLAGILSGGNKTEVCFSCELDDGRKFLAVTDKKTWQTILASLFDNKQALANQKQPEGGSVHKNEIAAEPSEVKEAPVQRGAETSQQELMKLAREGDPKAIAILMNRSLRPKGVLVKTALTEESFQILAEAKSAPPQKELVAYIENAIRKLGAPSIKRVKIYGKEAGSNSPTWSQEIKLQPSPLLDDQNAVSSAPQRQNTSTKNVREAAKKGDLSAISTLVQQAVNEHDIGVTAEMKYGLFLWLKLYSLERLNSENCLQKIAKVINEIQPKTKLIQVSEFSRKDKEERRWNKYLSYKKGSFFDNTKAINRATYSAIALALCGITLFALTPRNTPSPSPISTPAQTQQAQQNQDPTQAAQALLNEITRLHDYSRFIDTWGMGTQGLFLPEDAWGSLSADQQQILIDYARYRGLTAIIVGKQLAPNNIALDRTVWER